MSILAAIQSIISLPAALNGLADKVERLSAAFEKQQKAKWRQRSIELERRFNDAKTKEEYQQLAKDLQSLIRDS